MQKIMVLCCEEQESRKMREILGTEYEMAFAGDYGDAMDILEECWETLCLVLVDVDDPRIGGIEFMKAMHITYMTALIPIVILTKDIASCAYEDAYEAGAIDYVTYDMIPFLMKRRLQNAIETLSGKQEDHSVNVMEPASSAFFLFNHCIGGAVLMEYDGSRMRSVMINDSFYETVGHKKENFERYKPDLLASILPEDMEACRRAVDEVLEKGSSCCFMHNHDTKQVCKITYRHVARTPNGNLLLALVDDVTQEYRSMKKILAITEIPGTIVHDYDPVEDRMVISVSGNEGLRTIVSERFLELPGKCKWISPESVKKFRDIYRKALHGKMNGSFDFKGLIVGKYIRRYRLYYQVLADQSGDAFRIVGKIDDIESHMISVPPQEETLYDATTQLLTYQAIKSFIAQKLGENRSGTVMLVDIEGLGEVCDGMRQGQKEEFLRRIVETLSRLSRKDDVLGRFGEDGFILFLPEAHNEALAEKTAESLVRTISTRFGTVGREQISCNVGIAVADRADMPLTELLTRANVALWEAKERGKDFMIDIAS